GRGTRARNGCVSSPVGRMQRRAFRVTLRQQIGTGATEDLMQRGRIQNVVMNRVIQSWVDQQIMYSAGKSLRSKAAMHEPLLVPDGLERARGDFGDNYTDVRTAEGAEARLCSGMVVRVTRIERRSHSTACFLISDFGRGDQNLGGVEKGLVNHVDVHPAIQVATIADVAMYWIELKGLRR